MTVRMTAPDGVESYSHAGHEFEIGEDGTIEVADHVAHSLADHGFKRVDVIAPPSEMVSVRRETLLAALELLGAAANPATRGDKLTSIFDAAVKAKSKDKPKEAKADEKKDGKPA